MKTKFSTLFALITCAALVMGLFVLPGGVQRAKAVPVGIDTFDVTSDQTQSGVGNSYQTIDDASFLGGERDVRTEVLVGTGNLRSNANTVQVGQFSHSQEIGVYGRTYITYDGNDSDATAVSFTTMLANLSDNGANNALVVVVTASDIGGTMKIIVWTASNQCASKTVSLPADTGVSSTNAPRAFIFRYAEFTQDASCTFGITGWTAVRAVQIIVDGSALNGLDMAFDLFASTSLDFGDLLTTIGPTNWSSTFGAGGPVNAINSLYLGASVDGEDNAGGNGIIASETLADQDDIVGSDDENGIVRNVTPVWTEGTVGSGNGGAVDVTLTGGNGCLMGWIDWETDGIANATYVNNVINNLPVVAGAQTVEFDIPSGALSGAGCWSCAFYARFRLYPRDADGTCTTIKSHIYHAYGGEVEDYLWVFGPTAVTLSNLEAQPAPSASLLLAAGGALLALGLGALLLVRRRVSR